MATVRDRSGNGVSNEAKLARTGNYLVDIARGNVPGASTVVITGTNADIDNTREDLWEVGGVYVFPTVAQAMEVLSSSANDTSGGTGINSLDIHYLDSNFVQKEVRVTLNGVTPVTTSVSDIYRIIDVHAVTAGSNASAVGNIIVQNTANTITYAQITAANNRCRQAVYTVPAGKRLFINEVRCGVGASTPHYCEVMLRATTDLIDEEITPGVFNHKIGFTIQDGAESVWTGTPMRFPAGVDIKISVVSDSGTANVVASGGFSGWLENA